MTLRAIVTGASRGIGEATARLLHAEGAEVVLVARSGDALEELATELGDRAYVRVADVRNPAACRDVVDFAREIGPAKPVLVNNAGVAQFGDFATMPIEDIERQLQVNLLGPTYLTHAAIGWLVADQGHLVNVLSVTTTQVFAGSAAYSAGKAGLYMLGRVLAAEYRKKGLRVTSILPGAVDTPIWDGQRFTPKREDMLPATAVAAAIRDAIFAPSDRSLDEIHLMPPKGVL